MAKESVLTQDEKNSIEIQKIIFHIIIQDDFKPHYLEEVVLTENQLTFFKNRLIDASQGTQYLFTDKTTSQIFKQCKLIVDSVEHNFLQASKTITAQFKSHHNKNTSDGVFIVALAQIKDKRKLVFLIKIDHKIVYEYKQKGNKALLEEVKNTFIEDKKVLQKVALVDVSDHYSWDVLAFDRTEPTGITGYFKKFLEVKEKETPFKLTEKAISYTSQWAVLKRKELDPAQDTSSYKARAVSYLNSHNVFDTNEFIDYVIYDENFERKEILVNSFNDYLIDKGIAGQTFTPNKDALTKKTKKNVRLTSEGLKLEWEGEPNVVNIKIPNSPDNNDGLYHIIIKTSKITIVS